MREIFLGWLIPFLCGSGITIITTIVQNRRTHKGREENIENGLQALLRAEIIRQYEKWTDRSYCPVYAKEALKRIYEAYHALGGNDVATTLYNSVMELPTDR